MSIEKNPFSNLKIGDTAFVEKVITREDVETFARLTGDYNALHMDDEFAARTQFSQRVVHGFLHGSLLSTLVGMKMPGCGALYLSQELNFINPVFIGDTVRAIGTIAKIHAATRIIELKTEVVNQSGLAVIDGWARVRVLNIPEIVKSKKNTEGKNMSNLLEGKVALVTGASRGIGRAIAGTLAEHGAFVWLNYNKSERSANELAAEITDSGGHCEVVKADVTIQADIDAMFDKVLKQGKLDILINNAGTQIKSAQFENLQWQDMIKSYDDIVGSAFRVTYAALPALKESRGKIVNILTSAALGRTAYNWLPYVTAKSALLGLSKNLAQELGPYGIRVNMISPSMVETDLVSNVPEKFKQMMVAQTPLRRLATTDDVAGAALFLASGFSDFITGDNILITGGLVMA